MLESLRYWCVFIVILGFILIITSQLNLLQSNKLKSSLGTCHGSKNVKLEKALQSLFSKELGFTLIGEKPLTIEDNDYYLYKHPHLVKKVLSFLLKTFKNSPRFILKIRRNDSNYYEIELSNKESIKRIISSHSRVLAKIKDRFGTLSNFFECVSRSKTGLLDLLHANSFTRGMLLGYGKTNTDYFCRRSDLGRYLTKYPFTCFFFPMYKPIPKSICICFRYLESFDLKKPFRSRLKPQKRDEFPSLEDEWQWIRDVEWDLSDECRPIPPYYITLPLYTCRHGGDSERIRENYKKASGRLANLFCNRSFTEVIIEEAKKDETKKLDSKS